jgi:asparagine synthase (glutamine-hydrolysing)
MCGIAGSICLSSDQDQRKMVQKMNLAQKHRGPDGEGTYQSGPVCLGHVRLTIIDLNNGAQPFVDASGKYVLSYNGEVYNYKELKHELQSEFVFSTESDTEVVLKSYQKWGIDCMQHFRGMFAFALYDQACQKVFLVRDRLGIKPLYYYNSPSQILFCSELKALMTSGIIPADIDRSALAGYLKYQYVPTPGSIYQNVYKLEPGHYLEIDLPSSRLTKHQYWEPKVTQRNENSQFWLANLNSLVDETVSLYCRADVPFGSFLSGGVDSSLVTAAMSLGLSDPVHTFSIGFEETTHSELPHARYVSDKLSTKAHEHIVSPSIDETLLTIISGHFGEPFADSSAIPTYYVSQSTAAHVKMVLSGDGGDELFAGYDSYCDIFRDREAKGAKARGLFFKMLSHIPSWGDFFRRVKTRACYRSSHFEPRFDACRQIFSNAEVSRLMKHQDGNVVLPPELYKKKWDLDEITHFQLSDLVTYLHDDVLTKVDRMSMAHSLEVRVPILDHLLVEMAFSMPLDFKIKKEGGQITTKHILKQSTSRYLDWNFLNRPKQGFGIPLIEWCYGHLRPFIESSLCNRNNALYDLLCFEEVKMILDGFYRGNSKLGARVWALLMLDVWLRKVHVSNITG